MTNTEKIIFDIVYYVCIIAGLFLILKNTNMETMLGVLLVATAVRFIDYKERKGGD
jgi:hypothetical protein